MNGLRSELLKYRRTFTKKLVILLPLFFVLQAMPSIWLMPKDVVRGWEHVNTMVFNLDGRIPASWHCLIRISDRYAGKEGRQLSQLTRTCVFPRTDLGQQSDRYGNIYFHRNADPLCSDDLFRIDHDHRWEMGYSVENDLYRRFPCVALVPCDHPDPAMGCDVERHVCQHGGRLCRTDRRYVRR